MISDFEFNMLVSHISKIESIINDLPINQNYSSLCKRIERIESDISKLFLKVNTIESKVGVNQYKLDKSGNGEVWRNVAELSHIISKKCRVLVSPRDVMKYLLESGIIYIGEKNIRNISSEYRKHTYINYNANGMYKFEFDGELCSSKIIPELVNKFGNLHRVERDDE